MTPPTIAGVLEFWWDAEMDTANDGEGELQYEIEMLADFPHSCVTYSNDVVVWVITLAFLYGDLSITLGSESKVNQGHTVGTVEM